MLFATLVATATSNVRAAASSSELEACDEALGAADAAITRLTTLVDAQDDLVRRLTDANTARQMQIEDLERSNAAWYRDPLVIGVLGFAAGAVTATYIIRK